MHDCRLGEIQRHVGSDMQPALRIRLHAERGGSLGLRFRLGDLR